MGSRLIKPACGFSGRLCRTDLPVGRHVDFRVQPLSKKYSAFQKSQITLYPIPSRPTQGRIAIVTDAGRDAMDAAASGDEIAGRIYHP
jgi:hypothetical protein